MGEFSTTVSGEVIGVKYGEYRGFIGRRISEIIARMGGVWRVRLVHRIEMA
jgi:hypothetical protein